MGRLSLLPDDSLHLDILRDSITHARDPLPCANWAGGIDMQFATLGMASPFIPLAEVLWTVIFHGQVGLGPAKNLGWPACVPWDSYVSAGKAVHSSSFHHPSKICCEPYCELNISITRLRALVQFRVGSHASPIEQGRFARPSLLRHLHWCSLCSNQAVGDELHHSLDCSHFRAIRALYSNLFQDAEGSMPLYMGGKCQQDVSHCLAAILQMAQT